MSTRGARRMIPRLRFQRLDNAWTCSDCVHKVGDYVFRVHAVNIFEIRYVPKHVKYNFVFQSWRAHCRAAAEEFAAHASLFGMEQEYTFYKNDRPLGFPSEGTPDPQGKYYCSVGADAVFGREIVEEHLDACLRAGLTVGGINAEVMPGQWEFQVGPLPPVETGDHLWMSRYLLQKIAEKHGVFVSFEPKPEEGDWNGAGCHTNFSTNAMRESFEACQSAAQALGKNTEEHIKNYGHGIEKRLTGEHETCSYKEYKWGVSDRTASVRIPWQVEKLGKGYIEDRRPNANCDPYVVTKLILNTVCSQEEE